jgi:hypothetical protein
MRAKRTALALIDAGLLVSDLRGSIASVNISSFRAIEARSFERKPATSATTAAEEEHFYFEYDMERYWFAPLANCFGLLQKDVEHQAAEVISTDWRYGGRLHWEEDERIRRKILKHEHTDHSQGSYPRAEGLRFYLSVHAIMVVAGQLLATTPTYRSPDCAEDDFSNWFHEHGLSRRDGYWLADRRDPIPLDTHNWKDQKETGEWRSSVRRNDFVRVLLPSAGMVTVWGYWTSAFGRLTEDCHVRSALVSPGRSHALLRALQSADNHYDCLIPDAEDDRQIDMGLFRLKGWIVHRSQDRGVDREDPWAGGISYPAPRPSQEVVKTMNLRADREHRNWRADEAEPTAVTAETWETFREKDDEASEERGSRIQASLDFIGQLLCKFGMDMIVEVEIKRRRSFSRYESRNDDDIKPFPPSTRIFLIKADGRIRTV